MLGLQSILSLAAFGCIAAVNAGNTLLPTVDLGYELHQASVYNVCCRWGIFDSACANIRRLQAASSMYASFQLHILCVVKPWVDFV